MNNSTAINCKCKQGFFPERKHSTDAGSDLKACLDDDSVEILAGCKKSIKTGVQVEIPEGYVGLLIARSSLQKRGLILANSVGVIDSGYMGEITAVLQNITQYPARINNGERIVQLVIVPCLLNEYAPVSGLKQSDRGNGGFGSTNEKKTSEAQETKDADCNEMRETASQSIDESASVQFIICAIRCMKMEWSRCDSLWQSSIDFDGDVYAEICNEISSALVAIRKETYMDSENRTH